MMLTVRMRSLTADKSKVYAFPVSLYNDYTGEVKPNPSWVKEDSFCLTTDDRQFPFRVLSKENIICAWRHDALH